jgi:transcriptional regulator of acetoin/glycerol metabolism
VRCLDQSAGHEAIDDDARLETGFLVLEMCQGNRLRAAQILVIGRTSLYRYLKRDGYDTGKAKSGSAGA